MTDAQKSNLGNIQQHLGDYADLVITQNILRKAPMQY